MRLLRVADDEEPTRPARPRRASRRRRRPRRRRCGRRARSGSGRCPGTRPAAAAGTGLQRRRGPPRRAARAAQQLAGQHEQVVELQRARHAGGPARRRGWPPRDPVRQPRRTASCTALCSAAAVGLELRGSCVRTPRRRTAQFALAAVARLEPGGLAPGPAARAGSSVRRCEPVGPRLQRPRGWPAAGRSSSRAVLRARGQPRRASSEPVRSSVGSGGVPAPASTARRRCRSQSALKARAIERRCVEAARRPTARAAAAGAAPASSSSSARRAVQRRRRHTATPPRRAPRSAAAAPASIGCSARMRCANECSVPIAAASRSSSACLPPDPRLGVLAGRAPPARTPPAAGRAARPPAFSVKVTAAMCAQRDAVDRGRSPRPGSTSEPVLPEPAPASTKKVRRRLRRDPVARACVVGQVASSRLPPGRLGSTSRGTRPAAGRAFLRCHWTRRSSAPSPSGSQYGQATKAPRAVLGGGGGEQCRRRSRRR